MAWKLLLLFACSLSWGSLTCFIIPFVSASVTSVAAQEKKNLWIGHDDFWGCGKIMNLIKKWFWNNWTSFFFVLIVTEDDCAIIASMSRL